MHPTHRAQNPDTRVVPAEQRRLTRRSALSAATWSLPVVATAALSPAASASVPTNITSVEFTRFTEEDFRDGQINVVRPLSITMTGAARGNDLILVTIAGSMRLSGGAGSGTQATPIRPNAVNGPNFVFVGHSSGTDGSQTMTLRVTRDLAQGTYTKTISWVPLDGATVESTQQQILGWPLGTYTAQLEIAVAGIQGAPQQYTLHRRPPLV